MRHYRIWSLFLILTLTIAVSFGGCQRNARSSMTSEMQDRLQDMVQEFADTIQNDIIPAKDNLAILRELGSPISKQDSTYNIDALYRFYDEYEQGGDTAVNIIFSNTSFVVTRVIYEDGRGYYLRHQYDPKATGPLEVTTKLIDTMKLTEDSEFGKVELTLFSGKNQVAVFTFKNVDAADA